MIIVNSPLMHDEIIETLENNAEPSFTFEKKEGIKLYFETNMENQEEAAAIAKQLIKKATQNLIIFSVRTEEYI